MTTTQEQPQKAQAPAGAAPGPRGLALVPLLLPARRNPLRLYLELTHRHGDVVCLNRQGPTYLVSHPRHLEQVLKDNHLSYVHNVRSRLAMGAESLALAEGEAWRQKRRLMQPLFGRQRLAERLERLPDVAAPMLGRWSRAADAGGPVDLAGEMSDLILDVLIDLLLGLGPGDPGHRELSASVREAFEYFNARQAGRLPLLPFLARRRRRRLGESLARMEAQVSDHVARRRAEGDAGSDLLAGFLAARDSRDETAMTDRQVLDEVMMLLVMGHQTTATALTWTLHLLATHPEAEAPVLDELAEVLDGRFPLPGDLPRLEHTTRAIQEAMRLFPPTWRFARRAVAEDALDGYPVPPGALVVVSPWVTHRRRDLWPDPDRFDPERFLPGRSEDRPRLAYLPFGAGPRACIAGELAMMEMPLVVAAVLQRFRLEPTVRRPPLLPAITLQPRDGLAVGLERRGAEAPAVEGAPARDPATLADLALAAFGRARSDAIVERRAGGWQPVSTADLRERTARLVGAFQGLGLGPGDPVALWSSGGADRVCLELACWIAGPVAVPLHPGLLAEEAAALCREARAKALFVEDGGDSARLRELAATRDRLPDLEHLVVLGTEDGPALPGVDTALADLLRGSEPADLEARARERRPGDPATLAFGAGTTRPPRATSISHGAHVAAVRSLARALPWKDGPAASFLAPSEPVQQTVTALCLLRGIPLALAGSAAGAPGEVESGDPARSLSDLGPRILVASPDLFAWLMDRIYGWAQGGGLLRRRLFRWAVATGRRAAPGRMAGGSPSGLALRAADRLVLARLRENLGGRVETALCRGPLTPGWTGFLWALGIPVYECYGLAEAASPLASGRPGKVRPGTTGVPLPGVEVRIGSDGEVLVRGPSVPGDGWLATGDAGRMDDDGFLEVLGPKAHALSGPGGAPVHPGPVETAFRAGHFFSQALVVEVAGDGVAALLAPDLDALRAWARRRGLEGGQEPAALLEHEAVQGLVEAEVRSINGLLGEGRRVTAYRLLPDGFSRAAGELGPDGKLRRRVVLERRRDELAALRAEPAQGATSKVTSESATKPTA